MSGSDTKKQCPRCQEPVRVVPGGSVVVPCQSCSVSLRRVFQFCTDCGRESKGPAPGGGGGCTRSDCALQAALLSSETVSRGIVAGCPLFRQCPNCQALLSHSGTGCPEVQCPHCGVSFCYSCQQRHCYGDCITLSYGDDIDALIMMERIHARRIRARRIRARRIRAECTRAVRTRVRRICARRIRAVHIRAVRIRARRIHAEGSSAAGLGCAAPGVINPADQ
ncbi:uncharacterized protein LOC136768251 [Amia ocellicauda]|uniref:uncharacterized protein LOC136768251 n=1 Tax=Amia ocellicauda TaxID=2972642 RepID=UPI003463F415